MGGMSGVQISAIFGQWVGAAVCMVAVVVTLKGIKIEHRDKAHRGFRYITTGSVVAALGCCLFAIATKIIGF